MAIPKDTTPNPASLLGFNALAAERGDGLHPLLAEALVKTGSVSGTPAPSERNDENVVHLDFSRTERSGRTGKIETR